MATMTGAVRFNHSHEEWIPMPDTTIRIQNRSERSVEIIISDAGTPPDTEQEGFLLAHLEHYANIPTGSFIYVKAQYKKDISIIALVSEVNCGCPTVSAPVVPEEDTSIYFNGASLDEDQVGG